MWPQVLLGHRPLVAYVDNVVVHVAVEVVEAVQVRDPVVTAVNARAASRIRRHLVAHVVDGVARLAVGVALA